MDLYISSNGWTAWVAPDPVPTNSVLSSRQDKFVIVGFLPNGQFYISPNSFESQEQAQALIPAFDQQTITFEYESNLVKVFTCFNHSYWWQAFAPSGDKYPPQQIHSACNTTHAAELVGTGLVCSVS